MVYIYIYIFIYTCRYGEVFKTHILGSPCVMLSSPEAVRFVLVTQAHLFKPTYPQSKEKLIGPSALFFHQNDYHAQIRRLVQASLSLDVTRNLVPDIEAIAISLLDSWSGKVVNTFYELKKVGQSFFLSFFFDKLAKVNCSDNLLIFSVLILYLCYIQNLKFSFTLESLK